jgi:hypothetical protein
MQNLRLASQPQKPPPQQEPKQQAASLPASLSIMGLAYASAEFERRSSTPERRSSAPGSDSSLSSAATLLLIPPATLAVSLAATVAATTVATATTTTLAGMDMVQNDHFVTGKRTWLFRCILPFRYELLSLQVKV